MEEVNRIIIAVTEPREQGRLRRCFEREEQPYELILLDPEVEVEAILNEYSFELIIFEPAFRQGEMAQFVDLWSTPFIILTDTGKREELRQVLHKEQAAFLLRDPDDHYLSMLPLLTAQLLFQRKSLKIQNAYIRLHEQRYYSLVQNLPDIVFHLDGEGRIIFINQAIRKLGLSPSRVTGRHLDDILSETGAVLLPAGTPAADSPNPQSSSAGSTTATVPIALRDGTRIMFAGAISSFGEVSTASFSYHDGLHAVTGTAGIIRDITNGYNQQKLLEKSNSEKEQLLKEVHHRVRNNLQLILSLMHLHSDYYRGGICAPLLSHIHSEVRSIALAHEQFYEKQSVRGISLDEYLRTILLELRAGGEQEPQFHIGGEVGAVCLDHAIVVGLIVCELLLFSFTLRASSPDAPTARISIAAEGDGDAERQLSISFHFALDSALQEEAHNSSAAVPLMRVLAEQLGGSLVLEELPATLAGTISLSLPVQKGEYECTS